MLRAAKIPLVVLAALWMQNGALQGQSLPSMAYQPGGDTRSFFPISYQCPPRAGGLVEIVKMNGIGARIRFHVTYDGETVTHVAVHRAWRDTPFEPWHEFTEPRKKPEAEAERTMLEVVLWDAEGIRMALCLGVPTTRDKYDAILEHNRAHLKPTRLD